MVAGNKAILDHKISGRALRVFKGARGLVEYVGEFELDEANPWYTTDAPETGGEAIRTVIVFRLRPIGEANVDQLPVDNIDFSYAVHIVPIATSNTEKSWVDPARQPYEAELREAALVDRFVTWLSGRGYKCLRLRIVPDKEAKPIFNDIWIPGLRLLVEAKGTCTREAIRMAIGQLIDYGRFQSEARLAVLLPSKPRPDLQRLINFAGIDFIWEDGIIFQISNRTLLNQLERGGAVHSATGCNSNSRYK